MKREHQAARLQAIRLRYAINTHLEDRGLTAPPDLARAVGVPAAEARGRYGALRAVADRIGLLVPLEGFGLPVGKGRAA